MYVAHTASAAAARESWPVGQFHAHRADLPADFVVSATVQLLAAELRDAGRGAITASLCRLLTGAAVGQLAQQVDVPEVTCGLFD